MEAAMEAAGAGLRGMDWHSIDWSKVNRNVRRLQVRIAKAWREGKRRLARALQFILTRSLCGKALAVRRVTENKGKRTPGVDGEIWDTPEKKAKGIQSLRRKGYRAKPLRRVYIPKSKTKKRPLGIPIMRDRAMQALHKLAVDPIAEQTADPNSYGFREGRCTADAMEQIFNCLRHPKAAIYVLEADIKGCFDHIQHKWLMEHVPMDKGILNQWLKAGFIDRNIFHPTEEGTPQGGICSPVLANLALDGLEASIWADLSKTTMEKNKLHFVRYADDFIETASSREFLEQTSIPRIREHLKERGLELSEEKTMITKVQEGFDFLGQNVRKYRDGKLIIKPSEKSVKTFLSRIREIIHKSPQTKPAHLLFRINPIIRGWVSYHKHVVSKRIFQRLDYEITKSLWRWARRRHPHKTAKWVKSKYFYLNEQGRDWCFFGRKDGREVNLFRASSVAIQRHVKIKGEANLQTSTEK